MLTLTQTLSMFIHSDDLDKVVSLSVSPFISSKAGMVRVLIP